jgi:hypothetical protein
MLPTGWFLFPMTPSPELRAWTRPPRTSTLAPDLAFHLAEVLRPLREDRPDPLRRRLARAARAATSLREAGQGDALARALLDHLALVAATDGPRSLRYRVLARHALDWVAGAAELPGVRVRLSAASPATAGRPAPHLVTALDLLEDPDLPVGHEAARAVRRLRSMPSGPPVGLATQDLERVEAELADRGFVAAASRVCRARLALLELDRVERGVDPAAPDPELEAARLHVQARRTSAAWTEPGNPRE